MRSQPPRDYNGEAPLICWPIYWQVMAAKRTESGPPWWAVMAAKVREWFKLS